MSSFEWTELFLKFYSQLKRKKVTNDNNKGNENTKVERIKMLLKNNKFIPKQSIYYHSFAIIN